jgi:hypothetical protein
VRGEWAQIEPGDIDLYLRTPYYKDGKYQTPAFEMLDTK